MRNSALAIALVAMCAGVVSVPAAAQQRQQTARPAPPPQGGQGQQGQGGGWGRGPGGPGMGMGPPSPERMFAEMDANHDGAISKAEFTAFHARHHPMGPPPGDGRGPPPRR